LRGFISEECGPFAVVGASLASADNEIDAPHLNDDQDDFMATYLAANLELRVHEFEHTSRQQQRKISKTTQEVEKSSRVSRHHSAHRLQIKSPTHLRPLSKKVEKGPYIRERNVVRSSQAHSSRDELNPTHNEDAFEQYSAPRDEDQDQRGDQSIEDDFTQYGSINKYLEHDRRQEERRQNALKMISDYKIMAIEQQRSQRLDRRHEESKKRD